MGEPGNVHGADSSINGGVLSSVPSPFQISHLKEYQQPHAIYDVCSQRQASCVRPESLCYSGILITICIILSFKFEEEVKGFTINHLIYWIYTVREVTIYDEKS